MPRVRLKIYGSLSEPLRAELSLIINEQGITLLRLHTTQDGYVAEVENENDVSRFLEKETKTKLQQKSCYPILSPDRRAKHTLVMKYIDQSIIDREPNEISSEIQRTCRYVIVDDVYILKKCNMLKMRFNNSMANNIKEKGLRMFAFAITSRHIEHERFTVMHMTTLITNTPTKKRISAQRVETRGMSIQNVPAKQTNVSNAVGPTEPLLIVVPK